MFEVIIGHVVLPKSMHRNSGASPFFCRFLVTLAGNATFAVAMGNKMIKLCICHQQKRFKEKTKALKSFRLFRHAMNYFFQH